MPTSEGWKAGLTLEPPSGFEHGTPGLTTRPLLHNYPQKHLIIISEA